MSERLFRIAVLWLVVLATLWIGYDIARVWLHSPEPRLVAPRADLTDAEKAAVSVFQAISPSVAFVVTESPVGPFAVSGARVGTGSGFVWDDLGHIVTNHHVIQGADVVGVRLGGGAFYRAEVVGSAPEYDLAVLRISSSVPELQPIPIGSSEDLRVGQTTFAIGNPFGLSRTLTKGIISALDRRLPTQTGLEIRGVIQTDAAVNPGNSGGPLLDSAGRLIGVTTAIVSRSGTSAGIGFAVPVGIVNRVVPQLIEDGHVPRHGIGIMALSEEVAARLPVEGVVIARVLPGTPADKAGLTGIDEAAGRVGDVITHVNGKRVRSVSDLAALLAEIAIGEEAELTVERGGETRTVGVQVADISA